MVARARRAPSARMRRASAGDPNYRTGWQDGIALCRRNSGRPASRPHRISSMSAASVITCSRGAIRTSPPLVLLHGWMDVGASFQFLVDALARDWYAIAPDLRGFGRSAWQPHGYWFYDYLADLEALLDRFVPERTRAPRRPQPRRQHRHALRRRAAGARAIASCRSKASAFPPKSPTTRRARSRNGSMRSRSRRAFKPYDDLAAVADRLQKKNPRLPRDKAEFLAQHWARTLPDGRAELTSDPRHKMPFPHVYRMEESVAIWRNVEAPVLWVAATDSEIPRWLERTSGWRGRQRRTRRRAAASCACSRRRDW